MHNTHFTIKYVYDIVNRCIQERDWLFKANYVILNVVVPQYKRNLFFSREMSHTCTCTRTVYLTYMYCTCRCTLEKLCQGKKLQYK